MLPANMTLVSKEEFYAALKADPRDIMPRVNEPYFVVWETRDRIVFGWSAPGWKNPGDEPKYAIRREEEAKHAAREDNTLSAKERYDFLHDGVVDGPTNIDGTS